ncbi:transcriptional regulator with XRE-family HTH domain [Microbacterium natoriense]|uniref:Transcriptional regulator with XRE-family HTH domain n=1 Tax=Microbacterium natoriense TaxID=284570 RepID=A0AAW8EYN5_9MICO|nr:helix-turn-helix transcriptional regulator [Microbacterium natoriense]MDQ0648550.1 transcriptional regulator with XRE-family HTH domain [Microbacterium natoriense]
MDMGQRIAARIDALTPAATRKEFAERVGMAPDALSRALSGKRGFASIELVRIADELQADIHELITGEVSPHQVIVNARHNYDHSTSDRSVPTFADDKIVLEEICVAYAQASLPARESASDGHDVEAIRGALGPGFVRPFADRIEERLQIDVIRVNGLGTAYSGTANGRKFIAIPATGSWFRENWDLAHELAHVFGLRSEAEANAFAANLLLPEELLRSIDWSAASQEAIADFLWQTGVSTSALRIRLDALRISYADASHVLAQNTQRALRRARGWSSEFGDEITMRMEAASRRRFPLVLQEAHEIGVEEGRLGPGYLAWMRGVEPEWIIETYAPEVLDPSLDDLAAAFGLSVD